MAKVDGKKSDKTVAAEKKVDDGKLKALGLAMDGSCPRPAVTGDRAFQESRVTRQRQGLSWWKPHLERLRSMAKRLLMIGQLIKLI